MKLKSILTSKIIELYLDEGQLLSRIKKLSKEEKHVIRTHTTAAVVRGTEFSTTIKGKESLVSVSKGSVIVIPVTKKEKPIADLLKKP